MESDADLWKDGFFGRRVTRYLCVSKSQGRPEHVIESIRVLHDREVIPEGFSVIHQTVDTSQKAFKKKHICYKLAHFRTNVDSITEVIILSKLKTPPDGFEHIGDINGMHFCVRKVSAVTRLSTPGLSYGVLPGVNPAVYPNIQHSMNDLSINSNGSPQSGAMDRFANSNSAPSSPAHNMYSQQVNNNKQNYTNTLSQFTGLEGVPFILRDDLKGAAGRNGYIMGGVRGKPAITIKTEYELEKEYSYDFRTEREVITAGDT